MFKKLRFKKLSLLLLLSITACAQQSGQLTRANAAGQIMKSAQFNQMARTLPLNLGVWKGSPTDNDEIGALLLGLVDYSHLVSLTRTNDGPWGQTYLISLTTTGKAASASPLWKHVDTSDPRCFYEAGRECWRVTVGVPKFIAVTGITYQDNPIFGGRVAIAEYTVSWERTQYGDQVCASRNNTPAQRFAGFCTPEQQGSQTTQAAFRQYDDGWRLIN